MNKNKYIQAIENSIKTSMQEELAQKIVKDKEYKKKIDDFKLDIYLKYFSPFARSFKG
jgi:hypothetical protein